MKTHDKYALPPLPTPSPLREHRSDYSAGEMQAYARSAIEADRQARCRQVPGGWKEAAIAWEVCASIHRKYGKGKDPLFSTRQADFVKHANDARNSTTTEGKAINQKLPKFPTMLRKMWNGTEVQQWLDENVSPLFEQTAAPKPDTSL